jgi:steroid 5-alpha reductase family enzyme
MDALRACLAVYAGICLATWLLSVLTREYSWVDRIWSLAPIGYAGIFAGRGRFADARLDVIFALIALWGLRLTFNFARKGGYARGGEDYRWAVLRTRMTPRQFQVFNLLFITLYQNAILLVITLPGYTALAHRGRFGVADVVLTALFVAFLIGETVADQQQWRFQQWKRAQLDAGRDPVRFLQTGLFRYSRHPNFFFEQAQWWVVAAFGVVAARSVQWTVLGAVLLTLLFVGSTRFTESISLARYPEYAVYQRRTSAIVPWPSRRSESGHAEARRRTQWDALPVNAAPVADDLAVEPPAEGP